MGGKDWELHVTLATKVGVCIVPRVLVILEDIKAGWLETEWHHRDQRLVVTGETGAVI